MTIHKKSRDKYLKRIKELTPRNLRSNQKEAFRKIIYYVRGWTNYYKHTFLPCFSTLSWAKKMDELLRRRVRRAIWHLKKKPSARKRYIEENAPHLSPEYKARIPLSGKRIHRVASSILNTVMTKEVLKRDITWIELEISPYIKQWTERQSNQNTSS